MRISRSFFMVTRAAALVFLLAAGCGDDGEGGAISPSTSDFGSQVATDWLDLQLDLVRTTNGFSPPVAARAFACTGLTLYETVVSGMPEHQTLAGQVSDLEPLPAPTAGQVYHWPTAANSALASITRRLFADTSAENQAAIRAVEDFHVAQFRSDLGPEVFDQSAAYGRAVAEAIHAWSYDDGGHEGYLRNFPNDYQPPAGPGLWEPTPPGFQSALQPYWGSNRPFVLSTGAECDPGPPPPYSEEPGSALHAEAIEVYETVNSLTEEELDIALFWADDPGQTATPPGHSISILTQVLRNTGSALDVAAESYAKLGMAVSDAFVSCWATKYRYNLLRPVTYIENVVDPEWTCPVNTPPFPEYTSGHSVQSGAAAQVLTDLFGSLAFTDHTHDARGYAPRSFGSFWDAAEEAAISRLYGGIHYRSAIDLGLAQGECVGEAVSALAFRR